MSGSRKPISSEELARHAAQSPHWNIVEGKKLARTFKFPDFQKGLDFVNRVGAIAEQQGHHPDVHLSWGRVEIETWTHDAGGLTEQDFLLASKIDKLEN
jgi:4a-hydroxytetrahydrobiopterin dehydratase